MTTTMLLPPLRSSILSRACATFLLLVGLLAATVQDARATDAAETINVEKTHMGPYKALADFAFRDAIKGDYKNAIAHAVVLEVVWDRAETDFEQKNPTIFGQIDEAMDQFIQPILKSTRKAPDTAALTKVYEVYLEKLKLGN